MLAWGQAPEFVDVPVPAPGPGQVLVRVAGVGACHSDLAIMDTPAGGAGRYPLPFILGHETAGWVEEAGPGVRRVAAGDPVLVYISWGCGRCVRCIQGLDHWCPQRRPLAGMGSDGGLAEYQLVPDDRYLIPLGDLDPQAAGPLADARASPRTTRCGGRCETSAGRVRPHWSSALGGLATWRSSSCARSATST